MFGLVFGAVLVVVALINLFVWRDHGISFIVMVGAAANYFF